MKYGFIYETINLINGKKYIGSHVRSQNPEDPDDSWYLGSGTLIDKAINKYGRENFSREIICDCEDKEELIEKETYYLESVNAADNPGYYNLTNSGYQRGTKGYVYSQESLEKMRENNYVRVHGRSKVSRVKQSITLKENNHQHILADRVKDTIWVTNGSMNRRVSELDSFLLSNPEWYRGFTCTRKEHIHSEENREKMSEKMKLYAQTPEGKEFYSERMKHPKMQHSGDVWMSKEGVRKLIQKSLIVEYEKAGWKRGMNN